MEEVLKQIVLTEFGIDGDFTRLDGYQDHNFLLKDSGYRKYVIKVSDGSDLEFIKSQNKLLEFLSGSGFRGQIPLPLKTTNGELFAEAILGNNPFVIRAFDYIEGTFLATVRPDRTIFKDLGEFFGLLDKHLANYHDPVLQSRTHEWDLSRITDLQEDIQLIADHEIRRLTGYFLLKYREEVLPVHHKLPRQLIHSDGNDWNILLTDPTLGGTGQSVIAGLLDFGDMVYAPRINELAILIAYALMGSKDLSQSYNDLLDGYCRNISLSDLEINLLPCLVAARWGQTVIMAARQEKLNPGSAYHQVSVEGARNMLKEWIRRNPGEGVEMVELVELVEKRRRFFSKALSLSYNEPIHMTGAAFQYMYSADGRTYVDCVNNIPHVGHCHPKVVEAGQKQMARLNTNTRYLYRSLDLYAEKLLSKFPPSLSKVFFVNSGSAATDLAVRLIRAHTGRDRFLVLDHAYHGNTTSAVNLSPYKFNRKGGNGKPDNIDIIGLPNGLQGPAEQDLEKIPGAAAFFAEPIPGCAGQVMLNPAFMKTMYEKVRAQGGICVSDEVQTGFGRVGHVFWGHELYDVTPDIVLMGKPIANGHPMGAVVCTEEIAKSFENGMEFFSSFGGNPVSCEIAWAVLEVIEEEELQQNAKIVGDYLLQELSRHASRVTGHVSSVRGSGLFLGIEFVTGSGLADPDTATARSIVNSMKERGFLLSTDGPFDNVIKFKPPMCFTLDNARELVENLMAIRLD